MTSLSAAPAATNETKPGADASVPGYLVNGDAPEAVRDLESRGKFAEAKTALKQTSATKAFDPAEEAFRLDCLAREFSTTGGEMLRKIQEKIPDATDEDLKRWTEDHALSWIPVEGEIRYFRREPGILLRLNEDAKKRAKAAEAGDPAGEQSGEFSFTGHLRAALDAARDEGTTLVLPRRFRVSHTIALKPGKVPAGETVRCWMPLPRTDVPRQTDLKILSMQPEGRVASDGEAPQRTVYIEQKAGADGSAKFELKFEYTSSAYVPDLSAARADFTAEERQKLAEYLAPRKPHLLLTEQVTSLSRSIVKDRKDVVGRAQAIWSWLDENVRWCPEMEYVVMPNIVAKVLTERRGDCGTQALAFVALCRAAGVPARWQSGWVMKPGKWNLHDWAEFYAPGIGWIPADPSVGRQDSGDPAVRDFLFGNIDSYRMIANSDYGSEFVPPKNAFRSDPVDNQRGELEWKGGNLFYDSWSYDVEVEQLSD